MKNIMRFFMIIVLVSTIVNPISETIATDDPTQYQNLYGLFVPSPSGTLVSDNEAYLLFVYSNALELRNALTGDIVYRDPNYNSASYSYPKIDRLKNRLVYIKLNNDENGTAICISSTLEVKEYKVRSTKVLWLDNPVSIKTITNEDNVTTFCAYQDDRLLWEKKNMKSFYFLNNYILMLSADNNTTIIDPITGKSLMEFSGLWVLGGASRDIAIVRPFKMINNQYQFKVITFDPLSVVYSYDDKKMPFLYIDYDRINMLIVKNKNMEIYDHFYLEYNFIDRNGINIVSSDVIVPCDYAYNQLPIPVVNVHDDMFYLWSAKRNQLIIYNYAIKNILYKKHCLSPSITQLQSNYFLLTTQSETIVFSNDYEELTKYETPSVVAGTMYKDRIYVLASIYDNNSITNFIQKIKVYNIKNAIVEPFEYIINPGVCDARVAGTMTIIPSKYGLLSIPLSKQFRGIGIRLYKPGMAAPYYHILKNSDFYVSSYEILPDEKLAIKAQDSNQKYIFDIKTGELILNSSN